MSFVFLSERHAFGTANVGGYLNHITSNISEISSLLFTKLRSPSKSLRFLSWSPSLELLCSRERSNSDVRTVPVAAYLVLAAVLFSIGVAAF